MTLVHDPAPAAHPAHDGHEGHERLTIAAAALSVLAVLVLPPVVTGLVGVVPPVDRLPSFPLTERAERVAQLPGANVLGDSVVLTLVPEMHPPVLSSSQVVRPSDSVGQLVPMGVSVLMPMNPYLAPAGTAGLMSGLFPGDKVFANLGPLVASCVPGPADPPGDCTPTLLTQQSTGYYRLPGAWGTTTFLDHGSEMQAELLDVIGGDRVLVGGLPGTRTDRVVVSLADGSAVSAFTTDSASPGDTIWWATVQERPVQATAYDVEGTALETVDLDG